MARRSSRKRLKASRTVSGSQRAPSRVFHHPLKSTVHCWLGLVATTPSWIRSGSSRRGRRRCWTNPARSRMRFTLLNDGA